MDSPCYRKTHTPGAGEYSDASISTTHTSLAQTAVEKKMCIIKNNIYARMTGLTHPFAVARLHVETQPLDSDIDVTTSRNTCSPAKDIGEPAQSSCFCTH